MISTISPAVQDAIAAAIRWHEVRDNASVAYSLSFARIGNSGASFGFYQHDCAADPGAWTALFNIMTKSGMAADQRARISRVMGHAMPNGWPGSAEDLTAVNAAIRSPAGRAIVDDIDHVTLTGLLTQCGQCVSARGGAGGTIAPAALIGMACWINQSGAPTDLLTWLRSGPVTLGGKEVPRLTPESAVDEATFFAYYDMIPFVSENPDQRAQMVDAINVGMAKLQMAAIAAIPPVAPLVPVAIPDDADALNEQELASVESDSPSPAP
jgi:hypothetical protein